MDVDGGPPGSGFGFLLFLVVGWLLSLKEGDPAMVGILYCVLWAGLIVLSIGLVVLGLAYWGLGLR